jgi:hypothetical protein
MRSKDLVRDNIAYHHTLNQDVWQGDELRVDVRYKLLEIAKRFIEYLDVPNFKLLDVILRGSLTNYNYTRYSDFDLHIVTDYAVLNCDITEPFYMAKKKIWNDEHDIYIKGHEVELYVEDRDEENASEGMYSVLDNKWYKRPEYRRPDINDHAINSKARDLMTQINRAVKEGSAEDITRLQAKIKAMRQSGLDTAGEFSTENLAFKIIRNKGYIDKLYKTKQQKVDQELSLDEGGSETSWSDGNEKITLQDILELTKHIKQINLPINDNLKSKLIHWDGNPEEIERINQVTVSTQFPILIIVDEQGQIKSILDGNHRLHKAIQSQAKTIPAKLIKPSDLSDKAKRIFHIQEPEQPVQESEARLDPEVEEFLDGLTPDDVGYDTIGDYIVHYEGFTDQCQDSEEYQNDPDAVFDEVWSDFKKRMGGQKPVNYGIVGEHDYPIVYSVFRK